MQLKSFDKNTGKNAVVGLSESLLTVDDKTFLWNLAPNTHELFRSNRSAINSKNRESCGVFCVPGNLL